MKIYNATSLHPVTLNGEADLTELFNQASLKQLPSYVEATYNDPYLPPEAEEEDFLWITHKGDFIYVSAMDTNHLFNAFRMIFNHGVPAALRVGTFRRWNDVFGWSLEYKAQAFDAMQKELKKREDELDQDQKDELEDIRQNAETYAILMQFEDRENPMVGGPY